MGTMNFKSKGAYKKWLAYGHMSGEFERTPKARQKCVVDGKQVKIPVPIMSAMGGRRRVAQRPVGIGRLSR